MPRTTVNVYPSGTTLGKRTTNQRRSDQNSQMAILGTMLPFPEDSALTKDKISVLRLTGAYLKFQKFLQDAGLLKDAGQYYSNGAGGHERQQQSYNNVNTESHLFTSLLSKALDGFIMIVDQAGTVIFVSSDAADYISLTPSEVTGHTLYEVSHHDDEKIIKKKLMLNDGDIIEGNQVWRQFCIRVRSSISGVRSQVTKFGGFNMIHVSGFLKLAYTGESKRKSGKIDHGCVTVSPSNIDNYRVIGLVAECHLIESPVIMELTIQHSTFSGIISLDLKFTSVDTRVTQVLGFGEGDLVGQKIFDFFHPKEYYRTEHFVCWKKLMCQGRSTSPVYRFLTKNGEWIWMQMSATLTYVPETNIPYAANYTFKLINAENSETGKYKLVEHSEEYVMESNNCLPDNIKEHFPPPLNARQNQPKENVNPVITSLENTPLSEVAREAFFQARNVGMDTFTSGIQPARLDDGTEPVKMVPDYTENATLDSIFVPPTMSCSTQTPHGPDLYIPSLYAQSSSISSAPQSVASSLLPSPETNRSTLTNDATSLASASQNSYNSTTSHSPSSGYASSPGEQQSILHNHNTVISDPSQQLENHTYSHPQYSDNPKPPVSVSKSLYQNTSVSPPHANLNGSATVPSAIPHVNNSDYSTTAADFLDNDISLPDIDPSVFDSLTDFDSIENGAPADFNHPSDKLHPADSGNVKSPRHQDGQNQNGIGLSPYNYANSSIDDIIDQLIKQIPVDGHKMNSYPGLPN